MRRIAVRAIIVREGKLLCVQLKAKDGAKQEDMFWCVPGGGLDDYEDIQTGLERELLEETGVKPVIGALLYVQQYKTDQQEYLEFMFHVQNAEDFVDINLHSTSHGAVEIHEIAFVEPATSNLLPLFLRSTNIEQDIVLGVTQYFNNL